MLNEPMDVLKLHPIRKTKAQKEAFRSDVQSYIRELDYDCKIETGKFGVNNLVIGNPEFAKYLVTAHYDTPAGIGIPNVCNPTSRVRFLIKYLISVVVGGCVGGGIGLMFKYGLYFPGAVLSCAAFALFYLMLNGPANPNNANDNTSGVVTLLEIARTLPKAQRDKVCFVLFDQEEKGLLGSSAYRKAHKEATDNQLMLNLDCVGDGDHILFMPTKKARQDGELIGKLQYLGGWFGNKQILTIYKGYCAYNSDHKNFPIAVGVGAFHKKGKTFVLDKIHTKQDVNLDLTNVNLLRAALTTLICGDAVK